MKKSLHTFVFSDLWNDNSQFLSQKSLPLHLEWLLEHFFTGSDFWQKKHPVFSVFSVEFKSIDFKAVETSLVSPDCSMFSRISDIFTTLQSSLFCLVFEIEICRQNSQKYNLQFTNEVWLLWFWFLAENSNEEGCVI